MIYLKLIWSLREDTNKNFKKPKTKYGSQEERSQEKKKNTFQIMPQITHKDNWWLNIHKYFIVYRFLVPRLQ